MKIDISQLKEITNRILDQLSDENANEVDLSEDDYWEIPQEQRYNLLETPQGFTVGKLSDDWDELRGALDREYEPIVWHDLAHLAPILVAIGDKITTD